MLTIFTEPQIETRYPKYETKYTNKNTNNNNQSFAQPGTVQGI